MAVINKGRLINFISGITGVAAGGNAVVNMAVNQRYHRLLFVCKRVNYSANVTVTMPASAGGTPATFTVTVVNGAITAVAIATAGSGQTPGTYAGVVTDPTGTGAAVSIVVAGGGTVTATPTVTSGGTASVCDPTTLITSFKLLVNGVNIRDIDATNIIKVVQANLPIVDYPALGELPIFFTQPWMEITAQAEANSWDLFGQSTFQIQIGISSSALLPSVEGVMEFDYFRNTTNVGGKEVPFLQPVAQHQFSWPIVGGRNDINTLPYNYPIERMWFQGSTPGSITQVELYQDGNKILEMTTEQLKMMYGQYGFNFGAKDWLTLLTWNASNAYFPYYNPPTTFDAAYISDVDNRFWKALKVENAMIVRITSSIAQTLTIVQETLPGAFAS